MKQCQRESLNSSIFEVIHSILLLYSCIFNILVLQNYLPQHFLYFLPLPHGQSSFLPVVSSFLTVLLLASSSILDDKWSTSITCFLSTGSSIVIFYSVFFYMSIHFIEHIKSFISICYYRILLTYCTKTYTLT